MDFKQQLKEAYDKDAKRRDLLEDKRDQWKLETRKHFIELLKLQNGKSILELGSGAGLDAKYFKDCGFDVLATDLSREMIKMCQKRGISAKVIDLYNLETLKSTFDSVFSMNVLLHVPKSDIKKVLGGIYKILNNGGLFFYGVYGGTDEEKMIIDKSKMGLPRLFSFLSDKSLLELVKDKFEILEFKTIDIGSDKPNFHFQSLFLKKKLLG